MKQMIFSVFDEKAKAFANPFFIPNKGQAVRSFGDAVSDGNTMLSKHPGDYQLYEIGTFDESSAVLTSEVRVVGQLVSYKFGGDK